VARTLLRIARGSVLAAAFVFSATGWAQTSTRATAQTSARTDVMIGTTLTATTDLGFTIMTPQIGGGITTVAVTPAGALAVGVGASNPTPATAAAVLSSATSSAAQIVIGGERGQVVSVAMSDTLSASRVGGTETVSLTPTTDLRSELGQLLGEAVAGGGTLVFNIGGRTLPGTLVPGDYSGLIFVLAQYN
jgi:hypothetical protein